MKRFILFILLVPFFTGYLLGQTFCLRLIEVSKTVNELTVAIEVQGSTAFKLGSSNLQFSYNTTGLDNPVFESSPLAPPFYQIPTVTEPLAGETSFNIELAFETFGITISAAPDWTEVGQITFDIIDDTQTSGMSWSYNGGTTQTVVYLDDEATQIFATSTGIACLTPLDVSLNSGGLPVELLTFSSNPEGGCIHLKWEVAREENFEGYEIQRSQDGNTFYKVGWVEGTGGLWYDYLDANLQFGEPYYYRLKMQDQDGSYRYSPIRTAQLSPTSLYENYQLSISPNPAQHELVVKMSSPRAERCLLEISNENGQSIFRHSLGIHAGENQVLINVSDFPKGAYFINWQIGDRLMTEKIMIVR